MKKTVFTLLFMSFACNIFASSIAISVKGGYSPEIGGSFHSNWQNQNLNVSNGINDINRSKNGILTSTIEKPMGITGGCDVRINGESIYLKSGFNYMQSYKGGTGTTLNNFGSGDEIVEVKYSLWFFYIPITTGVIISFWNESRLFFGIGGAFAYGKRSDSFKSVSADHSATFQGYSLPLVAEVGGEHLFSDHISIFCNITYLDGQSNFIKDNSDSARIDFTSYSFAAGVLFYYDF
jgi:hypothetical protein